jgi:isoleucyl-tRNA synthetase
MVLALRRKVNIKVRQPLRQIMVPALDDKQKEYVDAIRPLVLSEVNVKELNFIEGSGLLVKKVKCNFRTMGKKYGKLMKGVAAQMAQLTQDQIEELEKQGSLNINVDGTDLVVEAADVDIISEDIPGWLVANDGNLTVALEVELDDDLRNEGMAREIINRVQNIRKDSGLEITDRINITIEPNDQTNKAIEAYGDYIRTQVLADEIIISDNDAPKVAFDDFELSIKITKTN